jgi:mRNA interferase MazF
LQGKNLSVSEGDRITLNVTRIITLDKSDLKEKIGRFSAVRTREILDGLKLVTEPKEV